MIERNECQKIIDNLKIEISKAIQFRLHQDLIRFGFPITWTTVLVAISMMKLENSFLLIVGSILAIPIILATKLEHKFYIRYRGWQYVLEWFTEIVSTQDIPVWLNIEKLYQLHSLLSVTNFSRQVENTLKCNDQNNSESLNRIVALNNMIQLQNYSHATMYLILLMIGMMSSIALWMGVNKLLCNSWSLVITVIFVGFVLWLIKDIYPGYQKFINPIGG